HQPDGKGLSASGFPPLAGTPWVTGSDERMIKLVLKGLHGPIEVNGKKYAGQVPMTPFGGMLKDEEVAAILTYVRNGFGNTASAVSAEKVKTVRNAIKAKTGFYAPAELLKKHPMEK
ncbi:MAG: cytochrome c, partial [Pedobacter sp.]